jgi:uncharacterized protein
MSLWRRWTLERVMWDMISLLALLGVRSGSILLYAFVLLIPAACRGVLGRLTGGMVRLCTERKRISPPNYADDDPLEEFRSLTDDLAHHPYIRGLVHYPGHKLFHNTSGRLHHSYSVAWLSYRLAKKMGLDPGIAARAGLLHDIGYAEEDGTLKNILLHGGRGAARTRKMGERKEVWEAISRHMFPLTPPPSSRHGWLLWTADKTAAMLEFLGLERLIWRYFEHRHR